MKSLKLILMFGALLFITACTSEASQKAKMLEIVEADIWIPTKIETGQKQPLQVLVTQGEEPVEDASEVLFELWNDSDGTESERTEALHIGEGVYQIEVSFENTGVYSVQTHVTARGLHVMPKRQFHVGDVTEEQVEKAEKNAENQKNNHMDTGEGHHH